MNRAQAGERLAPPRTIARQVITVRIKLKAKLILIFVVIFLIPILLSLKIMDNYAVHFSQESTKSLNINNMKYIGAATDQLFTTVYNFSLYLGLEKNIRSYLLTAPTDENVQSMQIPAQEALSILPFSNTFIKSIAVFGNDGQFLNSGTTTLSLSDGERARADQYSGHYFWSFEQKDEQPNIYFCRKLRLPANLATSIGYLKISMNLPELNQVFSQSGATNISYYIMDQSGTLFFSSDPGGGASEIASSFSYEALKAANGSSQYLPRQDCYITPYKIENTSWIVFSVSPNDYTPAITTELYKTFMAFSALCFVFCFILAMFFTRIIVSPLQKLGVLMEHIENEDYSVRFHAKGNDEITVLANQFDAMSEKLQSLYTQVYLSNLKLKQSQLSALQAQINPHFLYNTLDTIYWMSEFHHTGDVSRMISALSSLFRISISGDGDDMVPLQTEIEHVRCYMHIQQIRYQDQLSYSIDTQVDAEHTQVMKLILQPLVENAVIHGIGSVGRGNVTITVCEREGCLVYAITDDAGAADAAKINALIWDAASSSDGKGIGLKNINDRIILRYSKAYGIHCESDAGKTVFYVLLPMIRSDGDTNDEAHDRG